MGERWQLEGSATEIYGEHLVPAIFGPWAPVVVEAARLMPGERVLDVACGTGVVARAAAVAVGPTGAVTGVDLNPGMVAVARAAGSLPGSCALEYREADVTDLPFGEGSFDVVTCQLGLQYFPDRPAALAEIRRVLRDGGRFVALVWRAIEHSPGFAALAEALERIVGAEAGEVMRAPFQFGDDERPLLELVADATFADAAVAARSGEVRFPSVDALVRMQVAGSPLAPHVGNNEERLAALVTVLVDRLAGFVAENGLTFPIQAHLLTAQRKAR